MATVSPPKLLTAEEYRLLSDLGDCSELVRGVVVRLNPPGFRHGRVCSRIGQHVGNFVENSNLGHVISNNSGIITERHPDTVRGPDLAYYSYARIPLGEEPEAYSPITPELVFEVVSSEQSQRDVMRKVGEYLHVGVNVVCVVDPNFKTVNLHYPELPSATLTAGDPLNFAELPGFSLPVSKLFE